MFESIIQWLKEGWDTISPFFIIREYEQGVLLRFGKYKKTYLHSGIYVKIPIFDEPHTCNVTMRTEKIGHQSLTTKDGKLVVVSSMAKYHIDDVKVFLLEVEEAIEAISDITQGIIKRSITDQEWKDCITNDFDKDITIKVRREVKKWGIHIDQITITEIATSKTLRVIN